jgi:hypothetical protein
MRENPRESVARSYFPLNHNTKAKPPAFSFPATVFRQQLSSEQFPLRLPLRLCVSAVKDFSFSENPRESVARDRSLRSG